MKCEHRIAKDICSASWATPYDEIYNCKRYRKECCEFKEIKECDKRCNNE